MTNVVVPVSGNFFGEKIKDSSYYQIVEIDNGTTVSIKKGVPSDIFPHKLPQLIKQLAITDIIAHTMDKDSLDYITNTKVNFFVGVNISSPDRLINAYLEGRIKSNMKRIPPKKDTVS